MIQLINFGRGDYMLKLAIVGVVMLLSCSLIGKMEPGAVPYHSQFQVKIDKLDPYIKKQVDCLATNIYFEGRNQSTRGQIAVGLVTMNRVLAEGFPSSVCGVVEQKAQGKCQFSWWCNAKLRAKAIAKHFTDTEREAFEDIRRISAWIYFYHNTIEDFTHGATFYHATYIQPRWKNVEKTVRIEDHIFYRKRRADSSANG